MVPREHGGSVGPKRTMAGRRSGRLVECSPLGEEATSNRRLTTAAGSDALRSVLNKKAPDDAGAQVRRRSGRSVMDVAKITPVKVIVSARPCPTINGGTPTPLHLIPNFKTDFKRVRLKARTKMATHKNNPDLCMRC